MRRSPLLRTTRPLVTRTRHRASARFVAVASLLATAVAVVMPSSTVSAAYWSLGAQWGSGVINSAQAIDVDPVTDEVLVFSYYDNKIFRFDQAGNKLGEIGAGFGTGTGQINGPGDLAVAPNRDIFATDRGNKRVHRFSADGTLLNTFGSSALFSNPLGAATDAAGNVFIADVGNGTVRKFSPTGTVLRSYSLGTKPFGLGVDPDGKLWVADQTGVIRKADPDTGALLLSFTIAGSAQTADLDFDSNNQVHIPNFNTGQVLTYTLDGTYVDTISAGMGSDVFRIALADSGKAFVTVRDYIQVLDPPGPVDTDGDGIPDDLDDDPTNPSGSFGDATGTSGEILTNGTGAPVTLIDLPDPDGVKVIVGGTSGQVTIKACGFFTMQVQAGSTINLTCGSIVVTVESGGPLVIQLEGERVVTVSIPNGVTARISTPVNDVYTIDYLAGDQPIVVSEPSEPWDWEYPDPTTTWVTSASGSRTFSTNLAPTVDSLSLSSANVEIGEQVDLTAAFSDAGPDDTHTCTVTWSTGVTVPGTIDDGACTASYTYPSLGLKNVSVAVTDDDGGTGWSGASVLVYDADTYWTYDRDTYFDVAGIGIAVDPATQDVWIVENNANKVAKYSADGTFQFEVGGFGTAPGLFNSPSVVAVGLNGDAYITDVGGNRVQQFTSDGSFVRAFGAGAGTAFSNPLGIDTDASGNVYVADVFNGKVQKFSPTGTYLGTIGGTGTAPYAVGVDPDGFVWVSDFEGSRDKVHKINPATGTRVLTLTGFGQPVDITFDDVGQAHIVNFNTKEIRTHSLDGAFVDSRPMPVIEGLDYYTQPYPYRLDINGAGQLLLTNGSARVAVFDPPVPVDTDGDGIPDEIECVPDVVGKFCDADGAGHVGQVLTNGTGAPVTFVDLPEPDGVKVITGGTTGQLTIKVCGFVTVQVPAGSEMNVTCGSVIIDVIAGGPVVVTPDGGDGVTTVTIPTGVSVKISDVVDDRFTVQYLGGDAPVIVEINGTTTSVDADSGDIDFSSNVAPTIGAVTAPVTPVSLLAQPVQISATFSDPGSSDTHTCSVTWDLGVTTAGVVADGVCSASHSYEASGVYTVEVTVTDDADDSDTETVLVVVYDPNGGFVTGGGWFESEPGAYAADPALAGRAVFGFVSMYKNGQP
jgi:streptogramin lyase